MSIESIKDCREMLYIYCQMDFANESSLVIKYLVVITLPDVCRFCLIFQSVLGNINIVTVRADC